MNYLTDECTAVFIFHDDALDHSELQTQVTNSSGLLWDNFDLVLSDPSDFVSVADLRYWSCNSAFIYASRKCMDRFQSHIAEFVVNMLADKRTVVLACDADIGFDHSRLYALRTYEFVLMDSMPKLLNFLLSNTSILKGQR